MTEKSQVERKEIMKEKEKERLKVRKNELS